MDADPVPAPARATIHDVSRRAGVSTKTVSRVINNQRYVSAEKRLLVERAMADLAFQPSQAARALAGSRSHQVALICDNPNPWYVHQVQLGISERCRRDHVRMIAQPYDRNSPDLIEEIVALVDQLHPDGLILTPPVCDDRRLLAELARRRMRFVRIQPGIDLDGGAAVHVDNEQAAFEMTDHLLDLGHRRIGFVIGDRSYAASTQRLNGYARALTLRSIGLDQDLLWRGRFDFASGAEAAAALLALPHPPTAIFASSDDIAAGVLATAHRLGVAVPAALSVAGFDDTPFASIVWPALTTVRQPVRLLGETAAHLLLTEGGDDRHCRLAHEIVVRDSTGMARQPV